MNTASDRTGTTITIIIGNNNIYDQTIKWVKEINKLLEEITNMIFYCLNKFKLSDNKWSWVLKKCSENDNYVYISANQATNKNEEIELNSLVNNSVYNVILCYNTNSNNFVCWMKEYSSRRVVKEQTSININNNIEEVPKDIIYLYYRNREYLLYHSNYLIKKYVGNTVKEYNAIENLVKASGSIAIEYISMGYENAKNKLSVVDVIDELGINYCELYKKLLPFMIAVRNGRAVYDVHTLDVSINKSENESNNVLTRLKEELERCRM
ncbi:MAG: hypothetical protein QW607_01670 [Desulfurococcaceae archaeon]